MQTQPHTQITRAFCLWASAWGDLGIMELNPYVSLLVVYLTNRFRVAMRLFSSSSLMTSKCDKKKEVAHKAIKIWFNQTS